ncbi:ABC transporter ATP-binding protein [Novispirillum itersonii]|uniref:Spermidine/putrescine import ATP-binding protein PotA n=1 Tax=Novispirillum itersonii TaxID=189 RepID=A0A7W9ZIJ5_NOVIT|nr:ABC transporter ATP-binding protein [Novispirillum itersonii]MBB6211302.1 spermidine/putrescine transport system ATP-binding protein [Novispirillum itersonii]
MPQAVEIIDVVKKYGSFTALHNVSLDIRPNEFFTLLGPSGCGKTTLLRIIAGFEDITAGTLKLFGTDITALPPDRRPINTVFQHYSLFPHMTVAENVAFGLRRLKMPAADITRRVAEMLEMIKLSSHAGRRPHQLSGGQQQRVALARALAPRPKVLLLDEPLSALDLKLRQAMRMELKTLQQQTGVTFIFVTHDQEEALAMSDRIAVMSEGRVQQIDAPQVIYEHPATRFVADFIGDANFLTASVEGLEDGRAHCGLPGGYRLIARDAGAARPGQSVSLFLRPEKLSVHDTPVEEGIGMTVRTIVYQGDATDYLVELDGGVMLRSRCENRINGDPILTAGERGFLRIAPDAAKTLLD